MLSQTADSERLLCHLLENDLEIASAVVMRRAARGPAMVVCAPHLGEFRLPSFRACLAGGCDVLELGHCGQRADPKLKNPVGPSPTATAPGGSSARSACRPPAG